MRIRITPDDEPIEVVRVEETQRADGPCWVIIAAPVRVALHGGGYQAHVRYVVPKDYRGIEYLAA